MKWITGYSYSNHEKWEGEGKGKGYGLQWEPDCSSLNKCHGLMHCLQTSQLRLGLPRKQNPHWSSIISKQHVNLISLIINPVFLLWCLFSACTGSSSVITYRADVTTHPLATAPKTSPVLHLLERPSPDPTLQHAPTSWQPLLHQMCTDTST